MRKNAPYCLFKTEKKRVVWEVTHRCNYACVHCCSKAGVQGDNEMDFATVNDVLVQLAEYGIEEIYYSGGEPFIRDDMIDILAKTRELGILANVSTNGSLMTEELAYRLKALDVNLIHISLDSHIDYLFNSFRGGAYFDNTVKAIINTKKAGLYVRVGAVIWKENVHMIKDMIDFLVGLGVDEVVFNWLISVGRYKDNTDKGVPLELFDQTIDMVRNYMREYEDIIKISMHRSEKYEDDGTVCNAGENILFILPDGRISPCSWLAKLDEELITKSSLQYNSLVELLKSKEFQTWTSILEKRTTRCKSGCPAICLERNSSYYTEDPLLK